MADIVPKFTITDLRLGDTVEFTCKLYKNGQPFPTDSITDIWFTLKRGQTNSDIQATLQKTLGSGITITNSARGEISITLTAAETRAIGVAQTLYADIQIKENNNRVTTVCQGTMKFEFDITRST